MATELYRRFAAMNVEAALLDTPVVALNGARQVGKSTLVTRLLDRRDDVDVVTLDDRIQLEAAQSDPATFVERAGLLVIDEVQRVPDLLPAVKAAVDRDRRPGRFLLTGSARLLSVPEMARSLAGRVEVIDLLGLSQGELAGQREGFIDALFAWAPELFTEGELDRAGYAERVCAGGFPEPLTRVGRRRRAWFDSYATTVVQRMVADVADIQRLAEMPRLLRISAARTAGILNVRSLADALALPYRTVGAYLTHLESVFLVDLLPAWSRNLSSKVSRHPKLHLLDTGLAASILGLDAASLAEPEAPFGPLLETFVAMELRKQQAWADVDATMSHFRDRGGAEVDVVLESPRGQVVGVEVKASSTVRAADFRGLRLLADRLGPQFVGGVVLYTGREPVAFGDRLAALPVDRVWSTGARA